MVATARETEAYETICGTSNQDKRSEVDMYITENGRTLAFLPEKMMCKAEGEL